MAWGQRSQEEMPDFERAAREFRERLRKTFGGGGLGGWFPTIGLILALIAAWQSFYIVAPNEQGVVKRFGRVVRLTPPGPHFKIPLIETVLIPQITQLHRIEIGFRSDAPGGTKTIPSEALMLTGDMNILSVELIVQFRIRDSKDFLFNVADLGETITKATEAAIRQVIGESLLDEALTTGKAEIQQKTQDLLQKILDDYHAGVQVAAIQLQDVNPPDQVAGAFKDVASAKEDKEKLINQSQSYRNDIIPKAKGEAAQIVNQAQAYSQARVRRAEGEAARFNQMLKEYQQNKKVIRTRLFLETMEEVLPGIDKVIIDKKFGNQLLPYLPLGRSQKPAEVKP
ncbi:MAG TPA: FtsH protease activity modulator HflK [Nitrospiria bacterium]|jgi:membrane protease subunit HflK|nr:FtsH protease activity modulator HflK [Nitrospiria bacterium]